MSNTFLILGEVVEQVHCKPGWQFRLQTAADDIYPKLVITVPGYDSAAACSTADLILRASERMERVLKRGWVFSVGDPEMLDAVDQLHQAWGKHQRYVVQHFFPVPEATFNRNSWVRWIFEQCHRLENHELGEWFRVGNEQPFLPLHGPGEDPYTVHEFRPEKDSRITQDGSTRERYP